MSNVASNLIVRLIDHVSGPARQVAQSVKGIVSATAGAGGGVARAQAGIARAIAANNAAVDNMRGRVVDAVGAAYVLANAISSPIKSAMAFESAMADVRKVVDFPTPAAFKAFGEQIKEMSTRLPVAVAGLAEIAAAAGQAGIAQKDILRFTEAAAKIGVAFDISASESGEALAKMMAGLGMTIDEVTLLSDAMNHLSNAQASSAASILDVVRRVGASGTQMGFNATQTAAFASAMIAAGADSEVAATSFRNMGMALVKGASATKRQRGALNDLGLDAENVAKRMQEDAVGTTIDVLERINKLPKEMQAAVSYDLFGGEARALGPLITNIDLLKQALGLVADETQYAGSAQREFEVRSETSANRLQTFANRVERASIAIGDALLPAMNAILDRIEPLIDGISRLVTAFPRATATVIGLVSAAIALRVAMTGISFAAALAKGGILSILAPMATVAGGLTRLAGGAWAAAAGLTAYGARSRAAAAANVASMAGMSLVNQNLVAVGKSAKTAGAAMIAGMGSNAQAAARMTAGMSSAAAAAATLGSSGGKLKGLGSALIALLNPIALVRGAMHLLKLAVIGTGLGAIIVGIAAAGAWIYQNWSGIGKMFTAFGEAFMAALGPLAPVVQPVVDALKAVWDALSSLFAPLDESGQKWEAWGTAAGQWAGNVARALVEIVTNVTAWVGQVVAAIAGLATAMFEAGVAAFTALWEGMKSVGAAIVAWAGTLGSQIASAITNAVSNAVSSAAGYLSSITGIGGGGGGAAPAVAGEGMEARAKGGPVRAGTSYIVGEEGPEIFKPRQSGEIIPNGAASSGRPVAGGKAGIVYSPNISLMIHEATGDARAAVREFAETLAREFEVASRASFADGSA